MKTMKKLIVAVLAVVMMLAAVACAPAQPVAKTKLIDIALSEEQYAFAVNQSDAELLASVNAYLAQIKSDGTFDAICNRYFGDGTPVKFTSAAEDKSKDQLVVATSTGFEPFEMFEGGQYFGIDMEIAKGLAEYLGKELVIKDMEFKSVVTDVQNGYSDIAMAGLTITPAREAIVTFSNSYYSANQVLIVPGNNTEFDACKTAADVEAILKAKTAATKIGCQEGTTGGIYIDGDADDPDGYGFTGLPVTKMAYDYAALAVTAMINGQIDYVIVDNAPAAALVKAFNNK